MPMFDTVLQEKPAIVLEIGHAFTKLGFAGEPHPRSIIPSELLDHKAKSTGRTVANKKLFDYGSATELYDQLVEFLKTLFFKYVLVSPKERKVVIVESVLCPTIIRDNLAKALFCHFDVSSIFFVPTHLVTLATLAINTALVVDVGFKEAVIVPVYSGVQAIFGWQAQPLAAEAVHEHIKGELILNGVDEQLLTDYIVEDIKVRTCFVTTKERAEKFRSEEKPQPCPDVEYPVTGHEIIKIPGTIRETAFEVLFPQDNDNLNLANIILDSIIKCPRDMRKALAENIVLIGGSTMVLGLTARLQAEMLALLASDQYNEKLFVKTFKFHKSPAKANFVAWMGGSIYGATDLVLSKSITREAYSKNQQLPDFTNYDEMRMAVCRW
ncbi:actin-related protein 10 [Uranotaenia lowii]|uniref:actin-related protein 10 n=1 Tax=Uranotaenia lowii TaxID=190385 RepID=UPI002479CE17|nr:actin-related protein 10 [Uranotaenia lowii]